MLLVGISSDPVNLQSLVYINLEKVRAQRGAHNATSTLGSEVGYLVGLWVCWLMTCLWWSGAGQAAGAGWNRPGAANWQLHSCSMCVLPVLPVYQPHVVDNDPGLLFWERKCSCFLHVARLSSISPSWRAKRHQPRIVT